MNLFAIERKLNAFLCKIAVISDEKLKMLAAQPSYAAKMRYANSVFKKLKAGSSRIVYDYSPDLVLKMAKNEKGLAQNRVESDNFLQTNYKDLVANVIDSDPNDIWILSEKATKIAPSRFRSLTGIDFKEFCNYLYAHNPVAPPKIKTPIANEEQLDDNPFIQEILDMMGNFQMPYGDLSRISSWGEVKGRAVLIDYGLTQDIYEQYY